MQRDEGGGSQRRPVQHGAAGPQQRQRLRSTAQHEDERLQCSAAAAGRGRGESPEPCTAWRSGPAAATAVDRHEIGVVGGARFCMASYFPQVGGVRIRPVLFLENLTPQPERALIIDDGGVVSREDCFRIRGERGSK